MARNPGGTPSIVKARGAKAASVPAVPVRTPKTATPDAPKKRVSAVQFAREVRAEARKVTWTTWKETWITSLMVFIMVVITAIFFLVVDQMLGQAMQFVLKLGS
jgi:preprotein translocase subunit SecE